MTLFQAFVLGIVQGLTEFVPISSTGHLVLVPTLLGWSFDSQQAFIFDVLVQWGTLVAVVLYFRRELRTLFRGLIEGMRQGQLFTEPRARLAWLILLSSVPAGVAGLFLKSLVEDAIASPLAVSVFLIINALILWVSDRIGKFSRRLQDLKWDDSIWIGVAQILALFPGISRSGATISGGLLRDLERRDAARFSFLMSLPVMFGAGVIALFDLKDAVDATAQIVPLLIGFFAAVVVGYVAIRWLLGFLVRRSLTIFVAYCFIIGSLGILLEVWNA
jgi:undecaprenyl-diphosphatase